MVISKINRKFLSNIFSLQFRDQPKLIVLLVVLLLILFIAFEIIGTALFQKTSDGAIQKLLYNIYVRNLIFVNFTAYTGCNSAKN